MVADKDRLIAAKNRLLSEKIVLAQELQHRVRNNLQLVYGMLSKQLRSTEDEAGKQGISAIACRVMTLAKVHDHLLGAGLSRTIDFGGYLSSLCSSFEDFDDPQHSKIELTWEPLILDLDTVTALGLIIAELISNSHLHAFPKGQGTISVSLLAASPGGEATITFADNGVGFSPSSDSKRHGLGLVKRLMQQIGGSVEFRSDHGATCMLKFPVPASPMVGPIISAI
jgi:two-component sensor histidine kinase